MFTWLFFIAVGFAALDWYAAWKENRYLLMVAKPLTVIFMMLWSLQVSGWQGAMLFFGIGLLFSLGGDVALLFSSRWFLLGLASFLIAHVMFIIGFNTPMPVFSFFSLGLAVIVGLSGARILKLIRVGIAKMPGSKKMLPASLVYGSALALMLLSTILTFYNDQWEINAALCATIGATLFFVSDSTLGYDRFVKKINHGRFWVHITYHLGLFGIITGALLNSIK